MIYWLNRRVERAFEEHIRTIVPGSVRVYRSSDMTPRQFPCAVVRAHQNMRYGGELYACNRMLVSVVVMTEYARVIDDQACVLEEYEEVEEVAVSAVLEALYIDDLATQLNAIGIEGLTISYAQPGSDGQNPVTSQSQEDGTVSQVEIPLIVHAGAQEI